MSVNYDFIFLNKNVIVIQLQLSIITEFMHDLLLSIVILASSGCIAGTLAGFLGIGGGLLMVPILAFILHHQSDSLPFMQMASGTSLSIMIFSGAMSSFKRWRAHDITLNTVKSTLPGVAIFCIIGAIIAHFLPAFVLSIGLAIVMIVLIIKVLRQIMIARRDTVNSGKSEPHAQPTFWNGALIGANSGLFGLGGGVIGVPLLKGKGYSMRQATAFGATITLLVSLVGTTSFIVTGLFAHIPDHWSFGYIYIPALVCMAPTSLIFVNLGTYLNHKVSPVITQWVFLIMLLAATGKLLWTAMA